MTALVGPRIGKEFLAHPLLLVWGFSLMLVAAAARLRKSFFFMAAMHDGEGDGWLMLCACLERLNIAEDCFWGVELSWQRVVRVFAGAGSKGLSVSENHLMRVFPA
ncbi:hypothetical protein CC78DRAFT_534878 [Lojkania enalia]|uniref:Uncharacterized protein n=1 Tax=Lojkania enalia TaxID=147567 RepID=A0A9P4K4D7_9PLEO|nr:hypothetical protein CC78DRAFT_534878 [Didymosphaeria enalia]